MSKEVLINVSPEHWDNVIYFHPCIENFTIEELYQYLNQNKDE